MDIANIDNSQKYYKINNTDLKVEKILDKEIKQSEKKDYTYLCKKFPMVCFVPLDSDLGVDEKYKGKCDTSSFGSFGKVSIEISSEVMSRLEQDYDDIEMYIRGIVDNYDEYVRHAREDSGKYTSIKIMYGNNGKLASMQGIYFEEPIAVRENNCSALENVTKQRNLEFYLMSEKDKILQKLFEVGEVKKESRVLTQNKFMFGEEIK